MVLLFPPQMRAAVEAQHNALFRVYLTFEDGPTDTYTPEILDILAAYNAKATFFVNGYQLAGKEAVVQRIVREGHALGNHLWEEPGLYAGASPEDVRASYFRTEEAIRAALTPDLLPVYETQVKLFRQPGGGWSPFPPTESVSVITYNWHVSANDCGSGIDWSQDIYNEQFLRNVLGDPLPAERAYFDVYDYGDGVIVVMHDINRVTRAVLPAILSELQSAGASFHALPRPGDTVGTMPVQLGVPPVIGAGIAGTILPAKTIVNSRVRSEPHPNAAILIDSLPVDTPIMVNGRVNGWYRMEYQGQSGWIYAANVRVLGPIPSLPLIDSVQT
ncbi:MAG TPA: polysaccharide deacetylase family protein [Aggregatilineales bacterium]|nr:polysaccharide deacetylase family protein [Aggregatilineales bacterium]